MIFQRREQRLLRTIERMQHDHAAQMAYLLEINARLAGKPLPPAVRPPVVAKPERDDSLVDL